MRIFREAADYFVFMRLMEEARRVQGPINQELAVPRVWGVPLARHRRAPRGARL